MRSLRSSVVAGIVACAIGSAAFAQAPTNMNLFISQVGGPNWNWQSNPVGSWTNDTVNPNLWRHAGSISNSSFGAQWNLDLDADPFVSNNFALTNNTATTQTYTVTIVLPVSPIVPPNSTTFGSVSGTLGDTNNNGFAQLTTIPGNAIYTALIDGGTYQTLLPDVFTVNTPPVPGATTPFPSGSNFFFFASGQPGVNTSIAITNRFTLSAGDSVTLVSTFRVDPEIPAPAAGIALLGGLVTLRRRRA